MYNIIYSWEKHMQKQIIGSNHVMRIETRLNIHVILSSIHKITNVNQSNKN
jgi:hypothetical protein